MRGSQENPGMRCRLSPGKINYKYRIGLCRPEICGQLKQIVLVLFLSGAAVGPVPALDGPDLLRVAKSADAMGSAYSVELYGRDRAQLEEAADAALEEAQRLDDLLSNYKPESEWSQINQRAAQGPVRISPEMFQLLSACVEYSRESEGAFDITVGPLMKVWGFYKGTGHLPHRAEVAGGPDQGGLPAHPSGRAGANGAVRPPGRRIGPGRHRQRLCRRPDGGRFEAERHRNRSGGRVGQQHLRIGRAAREPQGWPVDIRDPWNHEKTVAEVYLKDMSMSTSGQLRKVLPRRRQDLRSHHGPAHGLSGAGQRCGFGDHAAHHR